MRIFIFAQAIGLSLTLFSSTLWACDLCALFQSSNLNDSSQGSFHLGISEQFSVYDRIQEQSKSVQAPDEHLTSSITRFDGQYDLSDEFGLRVSIPLISRHFRQLQGEELTSGDVTGLGDISILTQFSKTLWLNEHKNRLRLSAFAGLKLPTGDSGQLNEEEDSDSEVTKGSISNSQINFLHHDGGADEIPSSVHGHDLALGSGSVDFPLGFSAEYTHGRSQLHTHLEYNIRTEGDYDYRYANDFHWVIGGGYFLALNDDYSVLANINLGGEQKRKDAVNGVHEDDTGLRTLYAGPEIIVTTSSCLSASLGLDLPIDINNSGRQAVLDYRLRAGVSWKIG